VLSANRFDHGVVVFSFHRTNSRRSIPNKPFQHYRREARLRLKG